MTDPLFGTDDELHVIITYACKNGEVIIDLDDDAIAMAKSRAEFLKFGKPTKSATGYCLL
jgi:hypothetical protein